MTQHDNDLRKRYQAIDFVSEFQKYWARFNKWFKAESNAQQDRAAVDFLKTSPRFNAIVQAVVKPLPETHF